MKKKILVLSLSLCILLVGCTTEDTVEESQENTVQDSSVPVGGGDNEVLERSETLSDIIVETYGIDDATTIILNDTAIIGVRISYDQELTDEIVETIEGKVLAYDNGISEVLISDEGKIFTDIGDIVYGLLQGKSYDSLVNEINNIRNRI